MRSAFLLRKGLLYLDDKQNNSWLLIDTVYNFSSRVQLDISLVRCANSRAIELNTRRLIPYLRTPMYYSLFIIFCNLLVHLIKFFKSFATEGI